MATPSSGPAVYRAIQAVMTELSKEGIGKDRRNDQQKYNFRGIDDIYNALSGAMSKAGLMVLPRVLARTEEDRISSNGGRLGYVTVEVEFDIVASEDGSVHTVKVFGEAMDSADKATNKAMSAAFKYACLQVFCIPTEGDNDADQTTHQLAPKDAKQPEAPKLPEPETRQAKTTFFRLKKEQAEQLKKIVAPVNLVDWVAAMYDKGARSFDELAAEAMEMEAAATRAGEVTPAADLPLEGASLAETVREVLNGKH